MSDVRAAFSTGDEATIRDTAGELWSRISEENAIFLVTDPRGRVIASLGGQPARSLPAELTWCAAPRPLSRARPPASWRTADGSTTSPSRRCTCRPPDGTALLNVLVAGYDVDAHVARSLKESTGGSEFLFERRRSRDRLHAEPAATARVVAELRASRRRGA